MILIILFLATDTLKYDTGIPRGFYTVGEYKNDKLGVKFSLPYEPCKIIGVLLFADHPGGFMHASLCREVSGLPFTSQPLAELDTVYSNLKEWCFTPIETSISDTTVAIWFVLDIAGYPGIAGDTINPAGRAWYYSDNYNWYQADKYNWFIRLVVQDYKGYYEDFSTDIGGYRGDWVFINPEFIPYPKDNCIGTQIDSIYPNNARLTLISPWIKIKDYNFSNPTLFMRHFYETERGCDGGNVKISIDSINWQSITPFSGYDTIIPIDPPFGIIKEAAFTGNSSVWKDAYFTLQNWDSVIIKWHFISDGIGNNYPGWFIDEIGIIEKPFDDVGPFSINFQKIIPPETIVTPEVNIKNFGIYQEDNFTVECKAESAGVLVYQDEKTINSLGSDSIIKINFTPWQKTAKKGGVYKVQVYSKLITDGNRTNDTLTQNLLTFPLITSTSSGVTSTTPVIDGTIDSTEWKDATIIDGSDVIGIDTQDSINACNLYFMHTQSTLFIGIKAVIPQEIRIYMDDSKDTKWGTTDGWYLITPTIRKFYDYYSNVHSIPDSLIGIGNYGLEFAIPKGNNPYEITTGGSLGCFISVQNVNNNCIGWWPQSVPFTDKNNPVHYAKIDVPGLGTEETDKLKDYELTLLPNLIYASYLKIELSCPPNSAGAFKIYDLSGSLIKTFLFNAEHYPLISTYDISEVGAGVYFLVCEISNCPKITKKLVVIR